MKLKTESGSNYEILDRENVMKNNVFMFSYQLLGSINPRFVTYTPKPHIRDYEQLKAAPEKFEVGDLLIFQKKVATGNTEKKLHISAKIKKIKGTVGRK